MIELQDVITLPIPQNRDLFFTKQVDQDSISALTENILEIEKNDAYLNKLYAIHGLSYAP